MKNVIIILSLSSTIFIPLSDFRDIAAQTYLNDISKIVHSLGSYKNKEGLCNIKEKKKNVSLDHAKWTHMLQWK